MTPCIDKEIGSLTESIGFSSTSTDDVSLLDDSVNMSSIEHKLVVPYSKWIVVKCFSCDTSDSVCVAKEIPISRRSISRSTN